MVEVPPISSAERWSRLRRWMQPGLAIKRWVVIYIASLTLMALGLGLVLTHLYRTAPFPGPVYYVTLQFIPRLARGFLFLGVGALTMAWATLRLASSFLGLLVPHYRGRVGEALYTQRILSRGPKVVAIGGGTGLSSLLRGIKQYTSNITAVVTVCDDGGSSGRLRRDLQLLPPGDFRQCIAALADADPLVTRLFEHRFQTDGSDLKGHAFGNLFIAALAQITGSFEHALEESSRVLAVRGRILPSTLGDVTLCAELDDYSLVEGESRIPEMASGQANGHHLPLAHDPLPSVRAINDSPGVPSQSTESGFGDVGAAAPAPGNPIRRVFLQPECPPVYPEVVRSLLDADLIVIGPGSLYTSILPNLLVDDLARALCWSRATKIYVCNVATQPGETDRFEVVDHVRTIHRHLEVRLGTPLSSGATGAPPLVPFSHVLVNSNLHPHIPPEWRVTRPSDGAAELVAEFGVRVIHADVVDESRPTRHHPHKLASALMDAYGALRSSPASPQATLKSLFATFRPAPSSALPAAARSSSAD